jgi:hypothetical protein
MYEMNLELSYEELRSVLIETLKVSTSGQFANLRTAVAQTAIKMGLFKEASPQPHNRMVWQGGYGQRAISDRDFNRVQTLMWDLLIEGIIRPGLNDGANPELPFFHVTEWGQAALKDGPQTPYDPDGYLKSLKAGIEIIDPVIEIYLNESLRTFRINCLLSSTIALGCAAEKALLLLIASYRDSLPEKMREKFRANTEGRMIKRQFDEFRKMIESELMARLPEELSEGLDIDLVSLFEIFRTQRNDSGHPTGKVVERQKAFANLMVFPIYIHRVYALMAWISLNPKQ